MVAQPFCHPNDIFGILNFKFFVLTCLFPFSSDKRLYLKFFTTGFILISHCTLYDLPGCLMSIALLCRVLLLKFILKLWFYHFWDMKSIKRKMTFFCLSDQIVKFWPWICRSKQPTRQEKHINFDLPCLLHLNCFHYVIRNSKTLKRRQNQWRNPWNVFQMNWNTIDFC